MPKQLGIGDILELKEAEEKLKPDILPVSYKGFRIELSEEENTMPVLEWVNAKRREQDREPLDQLPSGIPGSSDYCPIAIAINSDVGINSYDGGHKLLPETVQTFIKEFDEGKYPELTNETLMSDLTNEGLAND